MGIFGADDDDDDDDVPGAIYCTVLRPNAVKTMVCLSVLLSNQVSIKLLFGLIFSAELLAFGLNGDGRWRTQRMQHL